jgi:hypothetical protein
MACDAETLGNERMLRFRVTDVLQHSRAKHDVEGLVSKWEMAGRHLYEG